MACVNKVLLIGNLTRDPQIRQLPSGSIVADIGIALSRRFTNSRTNEQQEETCFVDVSAFQRTAELIRDYCHKGDPLFIEGRLRMDQWEDRNAPGVKRTKLTVVAENIQLLSRRENAPMGAPAGYTTPQQPYPPQPAYGQQPYAQPQPAYRPQPPQGYAQPQPYPQQPPRPAPGYAAPMPAFQAAPAPQPEAQPPAPPQPPAASGDDAPVDDVPF